ncbi:uncharacterized protein RJT21DRAFT_109278 [Scheffersomyces amazonensis]|uniref:uncharacterized protein n=1 Tax=Scheffersomyces amazonensis TaxID=1078765 RepID=UPI00315D1FD2
MSTIPSTWRQFQLFDFTPIRDPSFQTNDALYSDSSLTSINATKSYLVIAVSNSYLKIIDPNNFITLKTFLAYDIDYTISFIRPIPLSSQNSNENLLVTLAEKQGSPSIMKLWDLNKIIHINNIDEDAYKFKFQTQAQISNGDNSYPISCFQCTIDLSCVAVGYTNGKVILIRGDLLRDRGSKQRLIYESNDPVTSIQFNKFEDLLYVTTTSKILTVITTGRNQGKPLRILNNKSGVDLNCTDVDIKSQNLIVGKPDSILYYNHINRIQTINFEMPKSRIFRYSDNYLLIISHQQEDSVISTNKKKLISRVVILDLLNKHSSFNLLIPNSLINHIFIMHDDIYLLSNDGVLYKLHEKPINQQIELILQRNLFPVAYTLAQQFKLSNEVLLRIQKLHAEYLYDHQDFDLSIDIFIKCLSLFEKEVTTEEVDDFIMNIITKFKDSANIPNLAKFLFALYELKLANNDHITLLLCCYCKLKLINELDEFITELNLEDNNLQELNFQLIINLFKECGYFKQVIKLLYKLNQPNLIVEIQLNELNSSKFSKHIVKQCLKYVKSLPIDELLLILIDHSKKFLDYCPLETTELLIKVFTCKYRASEEKFDLFKEDNLNKQEHEDIIEEKENNSTINDYRTFLNYLSGLSLGEEEVKDIETETETEEFSEPTYLPPKPSLIYPSFISHPNEFVIFLEACIESFEKYQGNVNDKKDLLITLLEMYLSLNKLSEQGETQWLEKARELTEVNSTLFDSTSLLLISHIYDFKEGEVMAKVQAGVEESLFRSYEISNDVEGCIQVIKKYGDIKPELYKMWLKFIISSQDVFEKVSNADFKFVLTKIVDKRLMNPLEVIQVLTENQNEYVTLGLVKDFLIDYFDSQNREISNNSKLIEYYENESTKNSHKLTELLTKPFIIQNNKCSSCQLKLDFPVIHFKCKHSYHQKCLADNIIVSVNNDSRNFPEEDINSRQCPICSNELEEVRAVRASQFKSKDNFEVFDSALKETHDKFKFISEYLGRGVMENESIILTND